MLNVKLMVLHKLLILNVFSQPPAYWPYGNAGGSDAFWPLILRIRSKTPALLGNLCLPPDFCNMKFSGQAFHGVVHWSSLFSRIGRGLFVASISLWKGLEKSGRLKPAVASSTTKTSASGLSEGLLYFLDIHGCILKWKPWSNHYQTKHFYGNDWIHTLRNRNLFFKAGTFTGRDAFVLLIVC